MPKRSSDTVRIDLSDVEGRDGKKGFVSKLYPEGDYATKIIKTEKRLNEDNNNEGISVAFKITRGKDKGGTVRDTFWLTDKALWRVRQLLEACGVKVPSKGFELDIKKLVGKELAITLQDDTYDKKTRSKVVDVFLLSELDEMDDEEEEDEGDEEEDGEDEEEAEDEEDEDEELDDDELDI